MINYSDYSKSRAEEVRKTRLTKEPRKMKTPKKMAVVDQAQCTGCIACVQFCPVDCIEIAPGVDFPDMNQVVEIDLDRCIGCKKCIDPCPWDTLHMIEKEEVFDVANKWTLRSVIHDKIEENIYWNEEEEIEAKAKDASQDENSEENSDEENDQTSENPEKKSDSNNDSDKN